MKIASSHRIVPAARFGILAAVAATLAVPASAQDEGMLRSYFEGHRVVLRIDMPGTSEGVDVDPDSGRPLDFQQHGQRLKTFGISLHAGQSATVTLVKVKRDLIEFQLDGGGFGTFSDDTSTSVYVPTQGKTEREKELERRIKNETDHDRRREMQRELDDLRERRERENQRAEVMKTEAEERKKERIAEERLRGGSRFNVRYEGGVPAGIRPAELMAALSDYLDFPGIGPEPRTVAGPVASPPAAGSTGQGLRKGMLRAELEQSLGHPVQASEHREGSLAVTTLVFAQGDERITADLVEGVLVRYSITSK